MAASVLSTGKWRDDMGITVGELLLTPHLRLQLHSGESGLNREVSWTHTSDLPEPWQWITGGELLMTNGLSFPDSAAGQRELLVRLVAAGARGLAIGEQMYCPALSPQLAAESDRLNFPVLWIRYPLPFVAISRTVAEATLLEQSQRLMRTARIYDAMQRTAREGTDRSPLIEALAKELGCEVHLCDRDTGEPWYPRSAPPDPHVTTAVVETKPTDRRVNAGAFSKSLPDGRETLVLPVPTHDQAVLVVVRDQQVPLDAILLQHAATVAALELSQSRLALEHDRRTGAELMAQLLDGFGDLSVARRHLLARGIDPEQAILATARSRDEERLRDLHIALWRNAVPHACVQRSGTVHALLPAREDIDETLIRSLGAGCRIGLSRLVGAVTRLPEAAREAAWALAIAERTETSLARYGDATPWAGLAGVGEAQELVDRVLRPLLDHDARHRGSLLETLTAFLSHQRSWQRTAAALHVHRQTVLYRIRKVEQVTGRDLAETGDISELWLALRAFELVNPAVGR